MSPRSQPCWQRAPPALGPPGHPAEPCRPARRSRAVTSRAQEEAEQAAVQAGLPRVHGPSQKTGDRGRRHHASVGCGGSFWRRLSRDRQALPAAPSLPSEGNALRARLAVPWGLVASAQEASVPRPPAAEGSQAHGAQLALPCTPGRTRPETVPRLRVLRGPVGPTAAAVMGLSHSDRLAEAGRTRPLLHSPGPCCGSVAPPAFTSRVIVQVGRVVLTDRRRAWPWLLSLQPIRGQADLRPHHRSYR